MTPEEPRVTLRRWRLEHELSQAQLASLLGVAWLTVQRWEAGVQNPPRYVFLALRELERQLGDDSLTDFVDVAVS